MPSNTSFPAWARYAVFYEIYPQSFFDANGDGIGDLEGLRQKLDYIRETGATAIWIHPFFVSPMRDAGYDVGDFRQVDPRYGTLEQAERLFAEARAADLRVLLDLVPGHTSIDHPWFRESAKRKPAPPYDNWYIWTRSAWDDGGPPWREKMIHGYAARDGNFLVNFFWSQPALNFGFARPEPDKPWQLPTTHPDVQALWREMRQVMRFWMERGADGFRVDMADSLVRNDPEKSEIRRFWQETRSELETDHPELFLIAEGRPSNLLDGTGFHAAFVHWESGYMELFRKGRQVHQEFGTVETEAFFDRSGRGDFRPYLKTWREQSAAIDPDCVLATPVGNHDLSRVATGQSDEDLTMVFAFHFAWPGVPFIYYGDEIGMRQQSADNPIHEGHYPPRNGARTPMQWSDAPNCGFSEAPAAQLYLPVDPAPRSATVAAQERDPKSLLHTIRALVRLRRETPALAADARVRVLADGAPGEPLVFVRGEGAERLLGFFQPAATPTTFELPADCLPAAPQPLQANPGRPPQLHSTGKIQTAGRAWALWTLT